MREETNKPLLSEPSRRNTGMKKSKGCATQRATTVIVEHLEKGEDGSKKEKKPSLGGEKKELGQVISANLGRPESGKKGTSRTCCKHNLVERTKTQTKKKERER